MARLRREQYLVLAGHDHVACRNPPRAHCLPGADCETDARYVPEVTLSGDGRPLALTRDHAREIAPIPQCEPMLARKRTGIVGVARCRDEDAPVGFVVDMRHTDEGLDGRRADAIAHGVSLALHDHAAALGIARRDVGVQVARPPMRRTLL